MEMERKCNIQHPTYRTTTLQVLTRIFLTRIFTSAKNECLPKVLNSLIYCND